MSTLIANIRRLPGGVFAKVPRSCSMMAMPEETTFNNLYTYFEAWPKGKSKFLLYGSLRNHGTVAQQSMADTTMKPKKSENNEGSAVEEHLYGPSLQPQLPAEMPPADGAASYAAAAAAAAKAAAAAAKPLGLAGLLRRYKRGEKLAMVTAYDFPSARFARGASVDLVLVGDSIGNCRLGLPDTVGVTMDDMLRATQAVRRGLDAPATAPTSGTLGPKPVLIGDMPFGSYLMEADALKNAAAFRMAGCDLVKLEGGGTVAHYVRALTDAGIPVMGHIGLTPQSASLQGGFRLQGTTAAAAQRLVEDAKQLAEAGAVTLVIECVPIEVGAAVQAAVPNVPVIGIGAGREVAGQVLVCDDFLGLHGTPPSFVKLYDNFAAASAKAYAAYAADVRAGTFPGPKYARNMKAEEFEKLQGLVPPSVQEALTSLKKFEPEPVLTVQETAKPSAAAPRIPAQPAVAFEFLAGRRLAKAKAAAHVRSASGMSAPSDVEILRTRSDVRAWRTAESRGSVALVPTMGNLHEGHLELVDEALARADEVVVSIFVNPAQFAAHEDLDTYPRTFEKDLELLRARGVRAVFAPNSTEMYPSGSPGGTVVVPKFVQGKSEDACRPHFFTGVATVCLKLFNLCSPDVVVFGQKDAMQCAVIAHMLEDLLLDSQISMVVAPTSREADGLARSSRNSYLTPGMRQRAPAIFEALTQATEAAGATPATVRQTVREAVEAAGMEVSYVSVADLREMSEKEDEDQLADSVVSIACLIREGDKECRLIDNVVVPA